MVRTVGLDVFIDHPEITVFPIVPAPIDLLHETGVKIDDLLTGAVVGRKGNAPGCEVEVLLAAGWKINKVFDGGAAETVERLVVVANHADILSPLGQAEEDLLLDRIGVLVLIDDHMFEDLPSLLILAQDLIRFLLK